LNPPFQITKKGAKAISKASGGSTNQPTKKGVAVSSDAKVAKLRNGKNKKFVKPGDKVKEIVARNPSAFPPKKAADGGSTKQPTKKSAFPPRKSA
jgi:hypothetical protein